MKFCKKKIILKLNGFMPFHAENKQNLSMDAALVINHYIKASFLQKGFCCCQVLIYAYGITIVALQLTKAFLYIFEKEKHEQN